MWSQHYSSSEFILFFNCCLFGSIQGILMGVFFQLLNFGVFLNFIVGFSIAALAWKMPIQYAIYVAGPISYPLMTSVGFVSCIYFILYMIKSLHMRYYGIDP